MINLPIRIAHSALRPHVVRFAGMNATRSGFVGRKSVFLMEPLCWDNGSPFSGQWPEANPVCLWRKPFVCPNATLRRILRNHEPSIREAYQADRDLAHASTDALVAHHFGQIDLSPSDVDTHRRAWQARTFEHFFRDQEDVWVEQFALPSELLLPSPSELGMYLNLGRHPDPEMVLTKSRYAVQYEKDGPLLHIERFRKGSLGPFEIKVLERADAAWLSPAPPSPPIPTAPAALAPAATNLTEQLKAPEPVRMRGRPPASFTERLGRDDDPAYACDPQFNQLWIAKDDSVVVLRPMASILIRVLFIQQADEPTAMVNSSTVKQILSSRKRDWGELHFSTIEGATQKWPLAREIFERPKRGFIRFKLPGGLQASVWAPFQGVASLAASG